MTILFLEYYKNKKKISSIFIFMHDVILQKNQLKPNRD